MSTDSEMDVTENPEEIWSQKVCACIQSEICLNQTLNKTMML